jgi:TPP-dependent 2-oxoacid decarboxylase
VICKTTDVFPQLGNGDFKVFSRIHSEITIAQADLQDPGTAPAEIDRVLQACYVDSRPVYIQLPTDMVEKPIDGRLLDIPIDVAPHQSDPGAEDMAVQIILRKLYEAKSPAILVDGAAPRRRVSMNTGIATFLPLTSSLAHGCNKCIDRQAPSPRLRYANGKPP